MGLVFSDEGNCIGLSKVADTFKLWNAENTTASRLNTTLCLLQYPQMAVLWCMVVEMEMSNSGM